MHMRARLFIYSSSHMYQVVNTEISAEIMHKKVSLSLDSFHFHIPTWAVCRDVSSINNFYFAGIGSTFWTNSSSAGRWSQRRKHSNWRSVGQRTNGRWKNESMQTHSERTRGKCGNWWRQNVMLVKCLLSKSLINSKFWFDFSSSLKQSPTPSSSSLSLSVIEIVCSKERNKVESNHSLRNENFDVTFDFKQSKH